jgi:ATP-dependent helicase/nuclease subunit B
LQKSCRDTTGDKITEALCEFLLETMQLQKTVLGLCRDFSFLDLKNLTDEFRQLWDLVIDVFESLHESLKDFPVTIGDYTELLRGVFSSVNIAKPPQVLDAVAIGDLERSRFLAGSIRAAFIVGANLGSFPRSVSSAVRSGNSGGFTGREIEALAEYGLEVSAKLEERYNFERFMVNKAMTLPSEKLYLTAPLSNTAWDELLPSPIFDELSQLEINKTSDLPLSFRVRTLKSARRIFAEDGGSVLEEVIRRAAAGEICDFAVAGVANEHSLTPETAAKLFNMEKFSPTAIETMMSCRFRFFCKYGLGIEIPVAENDEEPAAMERGNIIHHCLDEILREHKNNLEVLYEMSDLELDGLVEAGIKTYREFKLPPGYAQTKRQEHILMSFKPGIVRMLRHFCGDFANSCFKPEDFEKKVDFTFGADKPVRLTGKIDRVDRFGEYVRITDYKSGNKEMDFPAVFYGLDLQMLLYLFAVSEGGAAPSSALYMPSDGAKTDGVLEPGADVSELRRSWLSSHIPSGIVVGDGGPAYADFAAREQRIRHESNSPRKSFYKVKKLTPAAYDKLKDYCGKLVTAQVKRVRRGEIAAVPVAQSKDKCAACEYCDYGAACNRQKVKVINKELIERVISEAGNVNEKD